MFCRVETGAIEASEPTWKSLSPEYTKSDVNLESNRREMKENSDP